MPSSASVSARARNSSLISATLVARAASIVKSTSDPVGTGTRTAKPCSFPSSSGITSPIAFAAPVEVGTRFAAAARARRRSLCGASASRWSLVYAWTVVITPWRMPIVSCSTFATGARQLVVQEAFEMMWCCSPSYAVSKLTPSATVTSGSFAGAEMITLRAPASTCFSASARFRKKPVDSMTTSAPRSAHGSAPGSASAKTGISTPSTTRASPASSMVPGNAPYTVSCRSRCASVSRPIRSFRPAHSMSRPRSCAARKAARPVLPRPLIATRTAIIPPSSVCSTNARRARWQRHRCKCGSACVALPTCEQPPCREAREEEQRQAAGDRRDHDPVARRAVAGADGWKLDAHARLRGEPLHGARCACGERGTARPRFRQRVQHALRARQRLAAARRAVAVRHHDEQSARVAEEELLPEEPRVRLRLAPQRRDRSQVELLRDQRDPDREALLLRVRDDLVQLLGLRLRDLRVERHEGALRQEVVARRVSVRVRRRHREAAGRENRREQAESHPFARSTSRTSNGCAPGGSTSNVIAQWPTITSAGAARLYSPGADSFSSYACWPISMSSIANFAVTPAPVTGFPLRLIESLNSLFCAARFGVTWNWRS